MMTPRQVIPALIAPEPVSAGLDKVSRTAFTSRAACLLSFLMWAWALSVFAAPTVSNVAFRQQNGTRLVDISYDLSGGTCSVSVAASSDNGTTYAVPVVSVTGHVGNAVASGTGRRIVWDAGTDWPAQFSNQLKVKVTAWDLMQGGSYAFVPIPGGTYAMGNLIGDSDITDAGTVSVTLSPYYMAVNDTTKAQWDAVRTWGVSNGYTDLAAGAGKAANHPVQTVSWYDTVKWANAVSEKEGLTPCYTVSGAVVRTGTSSTVACDWTVNGYRLPTEAEWEVAARGGLSGKRFPWGNTISQSQANYIASPNYVYDLSGAVDNYHPTYATGGMPYTSPVGVFAANGYGLCDMAGNVNQWCWDWYGTPYSGGSDPRGPANGSYRVSRGSFFGTYAYSAQSAYRFKYTAPTGAGSNLGFRLARGRP